MDPINYSVDVQQPFQAAIQGYQAGAAIRNDQQQQQAMLEKQQLAAQQQADLSALVRNPAAGAKDYAAMTLKYPALREQFKQSWDTLNEDQHKSELGLATRAYAALSSNRPDIAESLLRDRAAAMRNSGAPEDQIKAQETWADLIQQAPEQARHIGGLMLSSVMGDKFGETFGKLGSEQRAAEQAPADLAKKNADASKAGIDAKYAEQGAIIDLQKKGWDIQAIQEDIGFKKEANRIAMMNAAANSASNDLKREELGLRVQEARSALDEKIRTKAADYEAGIATLNDGLNLLTEIRADKDTLLAATGAMAFRGAIPGTKARSVAGKIEQLQNTLASANLDKLKGAMSDKDILFLKNITSNLDRYQDEDKFITELGKIEQTLIRNEKQLGQKFGTPKREAPTTEPAERGTAQRNVTVDW